MSSSSPRMTLADLHVLFPPKESVRIYSYDELLEMFRDVPTSVAGQVSRPRVRRPDSGIQNLFTL